MGDAASAAGTAAPPAGARRRVISATSLRPCFARRVRKPGAQTNIVALPY
jgi:hypothetical protein